MALDPNRKRRDFHFAHLITKEITEPGDTYRLTFGACLRQRAKLMSMYAKLLLEADRVMRVRLAWLRRRGLLPKTAPKPRQRDCIVDLFAVPETPMPSPS